MKRQVVPLRCRSDIFQRVKRPNRAAALVDGVLCSHKRSARVVGVWWVDGGLDLVCIKRSIAMADQPDRSP